MKPESMVRVAVLLPDLLGTYGDGGNAVVLQQRLRWRGIPSEVVTVRAPDRSVPDSCDIYLIGGGEDVAQQAAIGVLTNGRGLHRAVDRGAAVLAVCGGLQLLGVRFTTGDGQTTSGLGLVDAVTTPGRRRAIGELAIRTGQTGCAGWSGSEDSTDATGGHAGSTDRAEPPGSRSRAELAGVGALTGFENHLGRTELGSGSGPLGQVLRGVGNGTAGAEGAVSGRVVCTYLHGPVLARNPALADRLLEWATGMRLTALPEFPEIGQLRALRIPAGRTREPVGAAAGGGRQRPGTG